ncbi:hypothetical protein [uncultured Vagococcus sp.]|uniref:hypothetical protein n=1 Tax=uncultured Vagococcus sp. TaxID=189676 RepID=UPI00258BE465|nr:hypothetical protein [uncultured Vagococcus sp.]
MLVTGGAIGGKVYADSVHQKKVTEAIETLKTENKSIDNLYQSMEVLRDKKDQSYLIKDIKQTDLDDISKNIESFKKDRKSLELQEVEKDNKVNITRVNEAEKSFDGLNKQVEIQKQVNALFSTEGNKTAINGSEVNLELAIKDELALSEIEKVVKATKDKDLLAVIPSGKWEQSIEELTNVASKQVKEIEELTQIVAKWFNKENKPLDTVKRDDLKAIEKRINSLKNKKAKEELSVKWQQVNKVVVDKEKAEAEKKAKATGGKVEQKADGSFEVKEQVATNNGNSETNTSTTGGNTTPNEQSTTNNGGGYTGQNQGGSGSTGGNSNGGGNQGGDGQVTPPVNPTPPTEPKPQPPAHVHITAPYATWQQAYDAGLRSNSNAREVQPIEVHCPEDGVMVGWDFIITATWD